MIPLTWPTLRQCIPWRACKKAAATKMQRPPLLSMNDIAREEEESRYEKFLHKTEEFPCVFNAKVCKLDIDDTTLKEIDVDISINNLNHLLKDLNEDSEVGECDQLVWKENLLTYVYASLNRFKEACALNRKILAENGMNNLVARVNAAFLYYKTDNQKEAQQIIDELKKVKSSQQFADMKYGAICELGYTFRKLGGAKNLQISISVLECALSFHPDDEAIQLMLAIVLRRCTRFHIYSSDPENINCHNCALKAAQSLWKLGTTSSNTAFRAAALIELAYLKYGEGYLGGQSGRGGQRCTGELGNRDDEHSHNNTFNILSRDEWFGIVQGKTWMQLCEDALEIHKDGPSEKVLKMAGELFRYCSKGDDEKHLKKSEQLLLRAIEKRPSSRAHHHLGLTYKRLADRYEQKKRMDEGFNKVEVDGCVIQDGWQNKAESFADSTTDMKCVGRGYNNERAFNRNEHGVHRQGFVNNNRGFINNRGTFNNNRGADNNNNRDSIGFARNVFHVIHNDFVDNIHERTHTNIEWNTVHFTEHHQDNLYPNDTDQDNNNKRKENEHQDNEQQKNEHKERFQSSTDGTDDCKISVLPQPPSNTSPHKVRQGLKYICKVPDRLEPFSKDNPYVNKAVYHLEQAVVLSHDLNKIAVYDYACILVQTEETEKSKVACRHLIRECISSKKFTNSPVYLVNAYNLIGVCYAKEAEVEVDLVNKALLLAEREKNLTMAVRQASYLAASVPELAECVTDLWNAFKALKRGFTFKGTKESRENLFRLCKYISDYKFLQAVDEIISQDPTELDKIKVVEQCLQRYMNMKAFDSALLFRDLVYLRPEVKSKLAKSKVYKKLMLEVAEQKLGEMFVNSRTNTNHPDPVWKQLFTDKYYQTGTYKKYDIVIVHDIDEDYEPKRGYPDTVSENLTLVLQEIFGLTAVRAHAEGIAGHSYVTEQSEIISQSGVAIFVLTDSSNELEFLASGLASLQISPDERSLPESARQVIFDQPSSEQDEETRKNENSNSLSPIYERIIDIIVHNCFCEKGASRILLVAVGDLKQEAIPQSVRGLPTLQLSPNDIETLKTTAEGGRGEPCLQLVTRLFREILGLNSLSG